MGESSLSRVGVVFITCGSFLMGLKSSRKLHFYSFLIARCSGARAPPQEPTGGCASMSQHRYACWFAPLNKTGLFAPPKCPPPTIYQLPPSLTKIYQTIQNCIKPYHNVYICYNMYLTVPTCTKLYQYIICSKLYNFLYQ